MWLTARFLSRWWERWWLDFLCWSKTYSVGRVCCWFLSRISAVIFTRNIRVVERHSSRFWFLISFVAFSVFAWLSLTIMKSDCWNGLWLSSLACFTILSSLRNSFEKFLYWKSFTLVWLGLWLMRGSSFQNSIGRFSGFRGCLFRLWFFLSIFAIWKVMTWWLSPY